MALVVFSTALGELLQIHVFQRTYVIFKKSNSTSVEYSKKQVQDFTSDTCGQHCVFFLYHMSKGRAYDNIVKKYYDDLIKNYAMVVRFVKRLKPCLCDTLNCIQCVQICKSL